MQHCLFKQVDYLDEEEERLAKVVASLIEHQDSEQFIRQWIRDMIGMIDNQLDGEHWSINAYHTQRTMKNFLKSGVCHFEVKRHW